MSDMEMSVKIQRQQRYCEMDWTDEGAKCKTNIEGMKCPRCSDPLPIDQEHRCGNTVLFERRHRWTWTTGTKLDQEICKVCGLIKDKKTGKVGPCNPGASR